LEFVVGKTRQPLERRMCFSINISNWTSQPITVIKEVLATYVVIGAPFGDLAF